MNIEDAYSPWAYRIAVSKDQDWLRGLIFVTLGLGVIPLGLPGGLQIFTGCCFLGIFIIAPYYRKIYGSVYPKTSRVTWTIIGACSTYLILHGTIYLDTHSPMAFLWTPLIIAPVLIGGFWAGQRHIGLTPWHWGACLALFLSAFLPLLGWRPTPALGAVFVGLALIVMGIVDHLRLTAAFAESIES